MQEKKYGLQLRVPKSHQKQQQVRPLIRKPVGFNDDDDDDVEREISRQAAKNKSLKDVEEQHKKALEEDPSVFDYDGVYDDMKAKISQPRAQDREQRKPKYIPMLLDKNKVREREHEIIYERKLAKERGKEDHLYADKDKFVTSAYKRKLAEQAKWMEEERLRELREEKDDVTKKSDISDFYFNLSKNVAYGALNKTESKKPESQEKETIPSKEHQKQPEKHEKEEPGADRQELRRPERLEKQPDAAPAPVEHPSTSSPVASSSRSDDRLQGEVEPTEMPASDQQPSSEQQKQDHHKKSVDALAAAKERFLARKKAKMQ